MAQHGLPFRDQSRILPVHLWQGWEEWRLPTGFVLVELDCGICVHASIEELFKNDLGDVSRYMTSNIAYGYYCIVFFVR